MDPPLRKRCWVSEDRTDKTLLVELDLYHIDHILALESIESTYKISFKSDITSSSPLNIFKIVV